MTAEFELARRVLLDAIEGLGVHAESIVLVGAQAVYFHTSDQAVDFVDPTTSDADLVIDGSSAGHEPLIDTLMAGAGFSQRGDPGTWFGEQDVQVDLMVVPSQNQRSGRRAALIAPHGQGFARLSTGLEATLVDNDHRLICAIEADDHREAVIRVAGPSALVIAKLFKLNDRMSGSNSQLRVVAKDSLDLLRLATVIDAVDFEVGFAMLASRAAARNELAKGLSILTEFGDGVESRLAALAFEASLGRADVPVRFAALAARLRSQMDAALSS